jgi:hypothetical protein
MLHEKGVVKKGEVSEMGKSSEARVECRRSEILIVESEVSEGGTETDDEIYEAVHFLVSCAAIWPWDHSQLV